MTRVYKSYIGEISRAFERFNQRLFIDIMNYFSRLTISVIYEDCRQPVIQLAENS